MTTPTHFNDVIISFVLITYSYHDNNTIINTHSQSYATLEQWEIRVHLITLATITSLQWHCIMPTISYVKECCTGWSLIRVISWWMCICTYSYIYTTIPVGILTFTQWLSWLYWPWAVNYTWTRTRMAQSHKVAILCMLPPHSKGVASGIQCSFSWQRDMYYTL